LLASDTTDDPLWSGAHHSSTISTTVDCRDIQVDMLDSFNSSQVDNVLTSVIKTCVATLLHCWPNWLCCFQQPHGQVSWEVKKGCLHTAVEIWFTL